MQRQGVHNKLGATGEQLATEFLISKEYRILARNLWLKRLGEIDILAEIEEVLCIVEVKTRISSQIDTVLSITPAKQRKLRLLGQWCAANYPGRNIRFDAILIDYVDGEPRIRHLEGILT